MSLSSNKEKTIQGFIFEIEIIYNLIKKHTQLKVFKNLFEALEAIEVTYIKRFQGQSFAKSYLISKGVDLKNKTSFTYGSYETSKHKKYYEILFKEKKDKLDFFYLFKAYCKEFNITAALFKNVGYSIILQYPEDESFIIPILNLVNKSLKNSPEEIFALYHYLYNFFKNNQTSYNAQYIYRLALVKLISLSCKNRSYQNAFLYWGEVVSNNIDMQLLEIKEIIEALHFEKNCHYNKDKREKYDLYKSIYNFVVPQLINPHYYIYYNITLVNLINLACSIKEYKEASEYSDELISKKIPFSIETALNIIKAFYNYSINKENKEDYLLRIKLIITFAVKNSPSFPKAIDLYFSKDKEIIKIKNDSLIELQKHQKEKEVFIQYDSNDVKTGNLRAVNKVNVSGVIAQGEFRNLTTISIHTNTVTSKK
ncbi:MAG: hypothetical protein J0H68_00610 [Sphingobacteriia bacterium]|nr:hypothetical protein [Sphingobacteriia bacterium]